MKIVKPYQYFWEGVGWPSRLRLKAKQIAVRYFLLPSFCKRCGRTYRDFIVPDWIWAQVEQSIPDGSTLCYDCFCDVFPGVWYLWPRSPQGENPTLPHSPH